MMRRTDRCPLGPSGPLWAQYWGLGLGLRCDFFRLALKETSNVRLLLVDDCVRYLTQLISQLNKFGDQY